MIYNVFLHQLLYPDFNVISFFCISGDISARMIFLIIPHYLSLLFSCSIILFWVTTWLIFVVVVVVNKILTWYYLIGDSSFLLNSNSNIPMLFCKMCCFFLNKNSIWGIFWIFILIYSTFCIISISTNKNLFNLLNPFLVKIL